MTKKLAGEMDEVHSREEPQGNTARRQGLSRGRMRMLARLAVFAALSLIALADVAGAAGAVKVQLIPDADKAVVTQPTTITITVSGAKVSAVSLPAVDGLIVNGSGSNPATHQFNFFVTPTRAGTIVIPAFDIRTDDGGSLHVAAIKLEAKPLH